MVSFIRGIFGSCLCSYKTNPTEEAGHTQDDHVGSLVKYLVMQNGLLYNSEPKINLKSSQGQSHCGNLRYIQMHAATELLILVVQVNEGVRQITSFVISWKDWERKDSHLKEHFWGFSFHQKHVSCHPDTKQISFTKLLHYLGKHVNQRLQLAIYSNDARFNIQRARFQWEIVFLFTSLLLELFFLKKHIFI